MGTRSTIALEYADGRIEQVYCHWDGYLEHNGHILQKHYMDPFKVQELIGLGGFSSLKETVEETKETAYTQRGEELSIEKYRTADEYFDCSQQEEFDYILRRVADEAVWFVRCYATDGQWMEIIDAAANIERINEEEDY